MAAALCKWPKLSSSGVLDTARRSPTFGLMYLRYMSNVKSEDTASISEAPLDVTAMNIITITITAPAGGACTYESFTNLQWSGL